MFINSFLNSEYHEGFHDGEIAMKDRIKEEVLKFIPQSMHEVEFKTKLLKIIGETKDEE